MFLDLRTRNMTSEIDAYSNICYFFLSIWCSHQNQSNSCCFKAKCAEVCMHVNNSSLNLRFSVSRLAACTHEICDREKTANKYLSFLFRRRVRFFSFICVCAHPWTRGIFQFQCWNCVDFVKFANIWFVFSLQKIILAFVCDTGASGSWKSIPYSKRIAVVLSGKPKQHSNELSSLSS